MDEEFDGVFLGGVEGRGLDEEALDFGAVGGGEPEGFELGQVELGEEGVVEVGELGSDHWLLRNCFDWLSLSTHSLFADGSDGNDSPGFESTYR